MIEPKYQRKNNVWWKGRKVITKEPVSNGFGTIGAGVVCMVTHKYRGLTIKTDKCLACGVSFDVSHVLYSHLYLLNERQEVTKEKALKRAKAERILDDAMGVVAYNGRYLVLPQAIVDASPYRTIFGCGLFLI